MPLYRAQIFKQLGGSSPWSNTYHIVANDIFSAAACAQDIAGIERVVHRTFVNFIRARVSSSIVGDNEFVIVPLGFTGNSTLGGETLPLFNTVRVDFGVPAGRPSLKYLRLPLGEEQQDGGSIPIGIQQFINDSYAQPILELSISPPTDAQVVDESANPFTTAAVQPLVQMRQTRRRRRPSSLGA